MTLVGFPPVVDDDTRVLVLGTMPGVVSLQVGQYYAHARNAFWRIAGDLLGFDPSADYPRRVEALRAAGIGLWDVMHSGEREGSLDSAIVQETVAPNDFHAFYQAHPNIGRVFFNGAKAEDIYVRRVRADLASDHITYQRLPSTSPANAATPYEAKLAAWRAIADG